MGGGGGASTAGNGGDAERTLSIVFDYRFDDAGFFAAPERQRALEAAARLWTQRLGDDFPARPVGDVLIAVDPGDPTSDSPQLVEIQQEVDDLVIFPACAANLESAGLNSQITTSGMVMYDEQGRPIVSPDDARYAAADFEPWVSSISFACDAPWFFDATPETVEDLAAGMFDFVGTAAHELGHALGISPGVPAFAGHLSGGTFNGPIASGLYGSPIPVDAHGHLLDDTATYLMESTNITRYPSDVEFAMLADIGYQVSGL